MAVVRPDFDFRTGREGEGLFAQVLWVLFTAVVAAAGLWLARRFSTHLRGRLTNWILASTLYPVIALVTIYFRNLSQDPSGNSVGLSWYLAGGVMCLAAGIAAIAMKHPLTLLEAEARELAVAAGSLEAERSRFESAIAKETRSIETLTFQKLSPTFVALLDTLQRSGEMRANSVMVLKIRESIDKVVRPFILRLTEDPKPTDDVPAVAVGVKSPDNDLPFQIGIQPVAAGAVVGLFFFAIGLRDQLWLNPPASVLLAVLLLMTFGAVYASHRVISPIVRLFSRRSGVVAAVLTSTVYSIAGISLISLVNLIPDAFLDYYSWGIRIQPLRATLTVILCSVSLGIAAAAVQNVNTVVESQKLVEADRRLHNAKLRTQLWYLRRQTALFVHGDLQSALTSSAMELERFDTDIEARARIVQRLQKALADLKDRQERPLVLEEALADIRGTWAGVAQVCWALHDIGASQIDAQPALSASVSEIVRESVSNAIRHGDATEIRVELRLIGGVELSIRITDNGRGIANSDSRGLGSSMLDETCLWWERTRDDELTALRARVAF
jgi:signal transduction histidine kinase